MLFRICAVVLVGLLWCLNPGISSAAALFPGSSPDNLGVRGNHLTPCPATPNCVVSEDTDATHAIAPISYVGDRATVRQALEDVLSVVPRTKIIEATDTYLRAESSSRLLGFVDDVEFYFPEDEDIIHIRSASRLGESDLGVNKRRLEQIRLALQDLELSPKM
ncbi:DUF1499 domain-containing protein [[Limnothrix rosea] IAM M-220]|uniref:DUF1499 domain-containing protein n=1 Tax=[Limnothrix rosea] IAM M-220 TaxID=454133 RepID=UPI0009683C54|nr:DUF1499 domain-containing protein [[Limnothrix rosea] IAM M-220]OKH17012.1 hypothetical protein NIES208_11010 [[Limnothrix rosea] IAM M-220]